MDVTREGRYTLVGEDKLEVMVTLGADDVLAEVKNVKVNMNELTMTIGGSNVRYTRVKN